ncbi:MAG: DUF305 domain-containing protein [Gemmatimonadota bacterium]
MYRKLFIAISINAVIMFALTYVMVEDAGHLYANINRAYMALIMAAPMVTIMLLVMHSMFEDRTRNYLIHAAAIGAFLLIYFLIRSQTPVGNEQFLRSMIPHHSSAILMCDRAAISDQRIIDLCGEIVPTQEEEIAEMQRILDSD